MTMDFEPPLNLISKTNELLDQCKKHIKLLKCIEIEKKTRSMYPRSEKVQYSCILLSERSRKTIQNLEK